MQKKVAVFLDRVMEALQALEKLPISDEEFTSIAKAIIKTFRAKHSLGVLTEHPLWKPFVKRNADRVLGMVVEGKRR